MRMDLTDLVVFLGCVLFLAACCGVGVTLLVFIFKAVLWVWSWHV
jgi:hypothetical protein